MELRPEDLERIYLEEKARLEIRQKLEWNQPPATYIVQNRPGNGVAAVLSFLIPGMGQIYKGWVGQGIAWLIFTTMGYFMFIFPGVILHLICIVSAASSVPKRQ
jgi:TM2 domain-containing membrane protein YozV